MNAFLSIVAASIQVTPTTFASVFSSLEATLYTVSANQLLGTGLIINSDTTFYIPSAVGQLNTESIFINADICFYTVSAISLSA